MRITNNVLTRNLLNNLQAAEGRMDLLQNQMSSGHRITKPSDDPVGIENALRIKSNVASVEQWSANASDALSYMNTADTSLGDITSMLQRIRELTVQAANGTNTPEDRGKIKQEVDQLTDQIRIMANTKVGNKFIFAGTATDKVPMTSLAGTWQGNSDAVKFQIGNNLYLPISVDGKQLFEVGNDGTSALFNDLKNFSDALSTLTVDANGNTINTSDMTVLQNSIDAIDKHIDNIVAVRADLGARINRLTAVQSQLQSTSVNLQQNLSDIQDADMAKSITDFTNQQNVFRAALSVGSQIIQPSLVDFMR